ncbi:hypothetical protein CAEBREN_23663 [Caenorhabditis brenneri]|uniref:Uncharacterized protein n=1 Tax=Caenorhabditis brenneri TaxID=135651 RepID=G0MZ42_CAEBE|nr:hypothetical protein CAEBREN_23663 [Caenorhabditis brenneri]
MSYLDESKTVKEFVRQFIKLRIAMRAAGGDLTSASTVAVAPSDSNSGSNSNSGNGQGKNKKKKKKKKKQVLDGNILGFRGAAASDRLNKGEINAFPTAPVNSFRR